MNRPHHTTPHHTTPHHTTPHHTTPHHTTPHHTTPHHTTPHHINTIYTHDQNISNATASLAAACSAAQQSHSIITPHTTTQPTAMHFRPELRASPTCPPQSRLPLLLKLASAAVCLTFSLHLSQLSPHLMHLILHAEQAHKRALWAGPSTTSTCGHVPRVLVCWLQLW
jgi:hypothetical protein